MNGLNPLPRAAITCGTSQYGYSVVWQCLLTAETTWSTTFDLSYLIRCRFWLRLFHMSTESSKTEVVLELLYMVPLGIQQLQLLYTVIVAYMFCNCTYCIIVCIVTVCDNSSYCIQLLCIIALGSIYSKEPYTVTLARSQRQRHVPGEPRSLLVIIAVLDNTYLISYYPGLDSLHAEERGKSNWKLKRWRE